MSCYVVAEISCNHNRDFKRALELISRCADAGADAVKFQTWTDGTMVIDRDVPAYGGPWHGETLYDLYAKAHTPWKWYLPMITHARKVGIAWFASVFDRNSLGMLEALGCPRYKIASFELVDHPLLRRVAKLGKPIILSTGMATPEEINEAVTAITANGCNHLTLLKCTSAYPADASAANLATMTHMARTWKVRVGLSDHTPGIGVAVVAAARGATLIEKHVTLSRADGGLDAAFSIEIPELALLVQEVKRAVQCVGAVTYGPTEEELPQRALRRSLYFAKNLDEGTVVLDSHLVTARPALGIAPRYFGKVVGKTIKAPVSAGMPVDWKWLA